MQKAADSTMPTSANAEGTSLARAPDDDKKPITYNKKKHFRTEGEKRFDFVTYNLIGYIANAALSVLAVWGVERTATGERWINAFTKFVHKMTKFDTAKIKNLTIKTFFLFGGFVVMAPMKWLEDKKVEWVKRENRKIYGEKADLDQRIVQSERELEHEPKQTWLSILGSRALALIPFYVGYGAIWGNKDWLARVSNPQLRAMSKEQVKHLAENDLSRFSQIATKGAYIDRPIANWLSRPGGKLLAGLTGNKAAVAKIDEMAVKYPGMVKHGVPNNPDKDPWHVALPYYVISEAITSGMVAAGVYALTRVLGPIFGIKPTAKPAAKTPEKEQPPITVKRSETEAAPEPHAKKEEKTDEPKAQVSTAALKHQPPAEQQRRHE